MNQRYVWGWATLVVALLAHLLLLWTPNLLVQAVAVLCITGWLPGAWLVELLIGGQAARPSLAERALYSLASGYTMMIVVMLLISYLPGGVASNQTLLVFDLLTVLLLAVGWWRADRLAPGQVSNQRNHAQPEGHSSGRAWVVAGCLSLLLIGGFLRFGGLGYSEFQGDEARAALRAAAVIQGDEDVLLIHKKGPTEILLPTVLYALTGHLNEATARLPFTLANLATLFAIFLLGWRLIGPLGGWTAAFLLAFDGYLIGFSQIVQYQSIVLLTSALVVLILLRIYEGTEGLSGYLTLAASLSATGLLSHYEALAVAAPSAFLLVAALVQGRVGWSRLAWALFPALLVGGLLLAIFYVPFVTHPHFAATYIYLVDRRISEGSAPYNNLSDFLLRSMVYNSSYYVLLMIGGALGVLLWAYQRSLPRPWARGAGLLVLLVMGLTFWRSGWLTVGERDWLVAPFVAALLLVWLLPKLTTRERTLWLWFGAPMLLAFFLTSKPRSHVYIFFTPWAILVGYWVAHGWQQLRQRTGERWALLTAAAAVSIATLVFGLYAYWYFVYNQQEVLRTWPAYRPAGYWAPYTYPDDRAIFGFPLTNGWKVVGMLYEQGVIQGDFETNEKEAWVPAWYTRGQERCGRSADWFFEIDNLEPWGEGDKLQMEHFLRSGFEKWGKVVINDVDRMIIYKRTGSRSEFPTQQPNDDLPVFQLDDYREAFDLAATPVFTLTYPTVERPIGHPLHVNLGNQIWLEGYDIQHPTPLRAGDTIRLTLYWRAQQPILANYKVFNQSYYGNGNMIAQQDGYPVCDTRETWRWDPGEIVADEYDIPVKADAPDGLYPLYTGMYIEQTFERLPVLDEAGDQIETQIHLTDIRIGVE